MPGHCYLALFPPMPLFIQEKMKLIAAEEKAIAIEMEDARKLKLKLKLEQERAAAAEAAKAEARKLEQEKAEAETLNGDDEIKEKGNDGENALGEEQEQEHALAHIDGSESRAAKETPEIVSSTEKSTTTIETERKPTTVITPSDRSRALAQSRLLLSETVASLARQCQCIKEEDSKKDYKGVQIQLSPSQKIWKVEEKVL